MTKLSITDIIEKQDVCKAIFSHLSNHELSDCALVNKRWRLAVLNARHKRTLIVTLGLLKGLEAKDKTISDYLATEYNHVAELIINGSTRGVNISNEIYDSIFNSRLFAKRLVLRGRGCWNTCYCPKHESTCGEQFGTIEPKTMTKLEQIHVTSNFHISACALLDLIARSPNLQALHFHGEIYEAEGDHHVLFNSKISYSNLDRVYWPWARKKHIPTLKTLIKRNENVTTFYSTSKVVCDLLAMELLPSVKFLSLLLNENWACKAGNVKNANYYNGMIRYLGLARNVEALEVRTFDPDKDASGCPETSAKVERLYESYRLGFWEQVAKLQNLKYLAIYGSWEFEKVCREMARHNLQIEYLKINLMPAGVIAAVDAADDTPILSMADGWRNLRKLHQLKSLYYICPDKLGSMDAKSASAMKEIVDLFWILDIKTNFTDDTEDLLNNVMRRGNQLGKIYKIFLHIQSKIESNLADLLLVETLKFPMGTNLRAKLSELAEAESIQRYGKTGLYHNFQLWGLEQVGNCRDKSKFETLKSNWRFYNEKFHFNLKHL